MDDLSPAARAAPAQRPDGRAAGTQRWRQLAFEHWAVPIAAMRAVVPARMALDLHEGVAYVGVVPFAMRAVQPAWLPRAMAFNFLETNVRTYVVVDGEPGVFFFSLEAASRLAVLAARVGFGLPYHHAKMTMATSEPDTVTYASTRSRGGHRHASEIRIGAPMGPLDPASVEYFLLERYLLFVERRNKLLRAQVHHTAYPVHRAETVRCDDELVAAAGLPAVQGLPALTHFSPGVDVEVFAPRPI